MKTERRPKPTTIDVASELGFGKNRIPDIGPGSHKPGRGRGGVPLSNVEEYYGLTNELKVPTKKGLGIGERVKQEKVEKDKDSKPKWSEII